MTEREVLYTPGEADNSKDRGYWIHEDGSITRMKLTKWPHKIDYILPIGDKK